MTEHSLLKVKGLKTSFFTRAGEVKAVDDVSFELQKGRILGLVGESGSGKSVTGFSIMGLIDNPGRIVGGQILYKGQDLCNLPEKKMRALRGRHIAMIFQDPMMTLNPVLRIDTQIIETIQAHTKTSYENARQQACEALELMGIASPQVRLKAYPHQLSGGMRQRIAIAIALLHKPDLIIADEPTTALDVTIQSQILSEIQTLTEKYGISLIWITHDLSVVAGLADEIAVMYAGRIVEYGLVDEVLDQTRHHYTKGLLDSLPIRNRGSRRLKQIPGITPSLLNLPDRCAFADRCPAYTQACEHVPEPRSFSSTHWARCVNPIAGGKNES